MKSFKFTPTVSVDIADDGTLSVDFDWQDSYDSDHDYSDNIPLEMFAGEGEVICHWMDALDQVIPNLQTVTLPSEPDEVDAMLAHLRESQHKYLGLLEDAAGTLREHYTEQARACGQAVNIVRAGHVWPLPEEQKNAVRQHTAGELATKVGDALAKGLFAEARDLIDKHEESTRT